MAWVKTIDATVASPIYTGLQARQNGLLTPASSVAIRQQGDAVSFSAGKGAKRSWLPALFLGMVPLATPAAAQLPIEMPGDAPPAVLPADPFAPPIQHDHRAQVPQMLQPLVQPALQPVVQPVLDAFRRIGFMPQVFTQPKAGPFTVTRVTGEPLSPGNMKLCERLLRFSRELLTDGKPPDPKEAMAFLKKYKSVTPPDFNTTLTMLTRHKLQPDLKLTMALIAQYPPLLMDHLGHDIDVHFDTVSIATDYNRMLGYGLNLAQAKLKTHPQDPEALAALREIDQRVVHEYQYTGWDSQEYTIQSRIDAAKMYRQIHGDVSNMEIARKLIGDAFGDDRSTRYSWPVFRVIRDGFNVKLTDVMGTFADDAIKDADAPPVDKVDPDTLPLLHRSLKIVAALGSSLSEDSTNDRNVVHAKVDDVAQAWVKKAEREATGKPLLPLTYTLPQLYLFNAAFPDKMAPNPSYTNRLELLVDRQINSAQWALGLPLNKQNTLDDKNKVRESLVALWRFASSVSQPPSGPITVLQARLPGVLETDFKQAGKDSEDYLAFMGVLPKLDGRLNLPFVQQVIQATADQIQNAGVAWDVENYYAHLARLSRYTGIVIPSVTDKGADKQDAVAPVLFKGLTTLSADRPSNRFALHQPTLYWMLYPMLGQSKADERQAFVDDFNQRLNHPDKPHLHPRYALLTDVLLASRNMQQRPGETLLAMVDRSFPTMGVRQMPEFANANPQTQQEWATNLLMNSRHIGALGLDVVEAMADEKFLKGKETLDSDEQAQVQNHISRRLGFPNEPEGFSNPYAGLSCYPNWQGDFIRTVHPAFRYGRDTLRDALTAPRQRDWIDPVDEPTVTAEGLSALEVMSQGKLSRGEVGQILSARQAAQKVALWQQHAPTKIPATEETVERGYWQWRDGEYAAGPSYPYRLFVGTVMAASPLADPDRIKQRIGGENMTMPPVDPFLGKAYNRVRDWMRGLISKPNVPAEAVDKKLTDLGLGNPYVQSSSRVVLRPDDLFRDIQRYVGESEKALEITDVEARHISYRFDDYKRDAKAKDPDITKDALTEGWKPQKAQLERKVQQGKLSDLAKKGDNQALIQAYPALNPNWSEPDSAKAFVQTLRSLRAFSKALGELKDDREKVIQPWAANIVPTLLLQNRASDDHRAFPKIAPRGLDALLVKRMRLLELGLNAELPPSIKVETLVPAATTVYDFAVGKPGVQKRMLTKP